MVELIVDHPVTDIINQHLIGQHQICQTKYKINNSKSSKTSSKKYFIYEIYILIFLHSFHPIHNTSVSDVSIEKFQDRIFRWKHRLQKCYELDGNYVEK